MNFCYVCVLMRVHVVNAGVCECTSLYEYAGRIFMNRRKQRRQS